MSGFEGAEGADHHERHPRPLMSVEIRAAEVVAALRAFQLAAMVNQFGRTIRTEAGGIHPDGFCYRRGRGVCSRAIVGF
jgi:hypothetical protein